MKILPRKTNLTDPQHHSYRVKLTPLHKLTQWALHRDYHTLATILANLCEILDQQKGGRK